MKENLYDILVTVTMAREMKVSARSEADAITMVKELLDRERVTMSRRRDLVAEHIEITGVNE